MTDEEPQSSKKMLENQRAEDEEITPTYKFLKKCGMIDKSKCVPMFFEKGATGTSIVDAIIKQMKDLVVADDAAFEFIRVNYFPKWDRSLEWKIVGIYADDGCDFENKTIKVKEPQTSLKIIHLIAHASTASTRHSKKWKTRMEQAARRAEELGHPELAEEIREDAVHKWLEGADKNEP